MNNMSNNSLSDKLSREENEFLLMPLTAARKVANSIQRAASKAKKASDEELMQATREASNGVFEVSHAGNNANQVDFRRSNLFREVSNKKDPGKKSFNRIADTIMSCYAKGRILLGLDPTATGRENLSCQHSRNETSYSSVIKNDKSTAPRSATSVINDIVTSICFFMRNDSLNREYIQLKGLNLNDDVQSLTNGVISCEQDSDGLHIKSATGREKTSLQKMY